MLDYFKKCLFRFTAKSCLIIFLLFSVFASAQDQIVSLDISNPEILDGESTTVTVIYTTTGEVLSTGLGIRLHFDSSEISCDHTAVHNLLSESNIGIQLSEDSDNFDGDTSTDKYINAAWVNIDGAWPTSAPMPASLYSLDCTALEAFNGTTLKFSLNSGASNFGFAASDATINLRTLPVDTTPPVITLSGPDNLVIYIGDNYVDAGAIADGGEAVSVSGSVDTSTAGTYTLTYNATDEAGNEAEPVVRTVMVIGIIDDNDRDGIPDSDDPDDDNDGVPDIIEAETGRNPLGVDYSVGTGNKYSCALDANGVTCWGANQYGQRNAPVLSNPTQLSVGFEHACAIDDTGVVCWGRNHRGQGTVPALSNPTAVAAGKLHTCAIDDTGVVCWGSNGFKRSDVPAEVVNATQIEAGNEHTCSVGDNGVVCWGRNHKQQRKVPDGLVNPTQVSAGYIHSCAVDDNGVTCWGQQDARSVVPAGLVNPTQVSAGGLSTCAIDDNGVTCWGAANIMAVPALSNPTQVSVDYNHACAQDDTGVVCWGNNDKGKRTTPALSHVTDHDGDGMSDVEELLLGTDRFVADSDGDSVVDGLDFAPLDASESADTDKDGIGNNADTDDDNDGIPDDLEIASGRNPLAVDYAVGTGNKYSCAMDANGVTCWGANQYGQRNAPVLSNPTQLSVGFEHACAIDDTGVVCWGRDHQGQATVPSLSNPTSVSAGKLHTCAIDDSGVVCWGSNAFKRSTVPANLVNPTQIDAGTEHNCAIGDNGVVCWGRNHKKQRKVPTDLVNPTQVSAGYIHSCAIDDSGVRCWGQQDARVAVPEGLVNPTQVSAGGLSTCAIDDNGVTCWGAANIVNVPNLSNPTQVSVDFNHACAQDDTGVRCWGNNDKGKRTPPALSHVIDQDGDGVDDKFDTDRLDSAVQ